MHTNKRRGKRYIKAYKNENCKATHSNLKNKKKTFSLYNIYIIKNSLVGDLKVRNTKRMTIELQGA